MTGHEAIEYAEAHNLALSKYADPIDDACDGLTPNEARVIASEDPSLIYLPKEHHVAIHCGGIIGTAASEYEAALACEALGYDVVARTGGGQIDFYDAEDGPGVQGYEPDGLGVWIVSCE